jgi:DNA repair protein RadA/Sms
MAKPKTRARCTACGHVEPRWVGRCPGCGDWGTLEQETVAAATPARPATTPAVAATPIAEIPLDADQRIVTGVAELDRVLGGGLVPGSVTLLGGEPGAGKSTLLLQAVDRLAAGGHTVLYVSAEESAGQVRLRAERLGALHERLLFAGESDLAVIAGLVEAHRPAVMVVDSVQTVSDAEVSGVPGGMGQVRAAGGTLTRLAKDTGTATILVGHVTKDGSLAGPRVLEHLVDTVADIDGDRHHALRLLRTVKNRFGPVGEVGCFEMTSDGLVGVRDPGRLFVGESAESATGVAVTITLEGSRPLACEVQALVAASGLPHPRRAASGLDGQRLHLLAAVLERRANVRLSEADLYVSTVGGLRVTEPAVDLALCLAVASSTWDVPVPRDLVAVAEVGLAGELRLVAQTERRLAEAARLGFTRALLPAAYDGDAHGLALLRESTLGDGLGAALQRAVSLPSR